MPGAYQEHGLDGGAACDVDQFIDVLLRVLKDVEHGQEETAALGDFWESVPDSLSGCDTTWCCSGIGGGSCARGIRHPMTRHHSIAGPSFTSSAFHDRRVIIQRIAPRARPGTG